jgi:hypothetical protein
MFNRISLLVSALGVLVGGLLVFVTFSQYQDGASAGWAIAASLVFISASVALARDLTRLKNARR